MSAIIPDPEQPERLALDSEGGLLFGAFIRRIDSPEAPAACELLDRTEWEHVGWSKGIDTPPRPRTRARVKETTDE